MMIFIIIAVVLNAMTYSGPRHSLSQFNALQIRSLSKTLGATPHKGAIPAWASKCRTEPSPAIIQMDSLSK